MPPKLLVSVRDSQEAEIAARHGVSIIDIKDPGQGSLGMASPARIHECVDIVHQIAPQALVSAACGEVVGWNLPVNLEPANFSNLSYLKLGLSQLKHSSDWRNQWQNVRQQITALQDAPPSWIAVCYADVEGAQSPTIEDIIQAAGETGCAGVLFDTFSKSQCRFSDWISDEQLTEYLQQIHALGMFCATAGRLTPADVSRLAKFPVDIIAVRSAACKSGDRTETISAKRIADLLERIERSATCSVSVNA